MSNQLLLLAYMNRDQIIASAKRTVRLEADALLTIEQFINDDFVRAVEAIYLSKGRLVVSGIGKSAIIAQKLVATFNSTGTAAIFMHAADAIHGDLGMVQPNDMVMIISKSGESPEIKVLVPLIKHMKHTLISIVGNAQSFLAAHSDIVLNTTVEIEACPNNLAPTSSTTAQLVMGDALAVCLMEIKGFGSSDFAKFHPGGALGKKLYLRVEELYKRNEKPSVTEDANLKQVIVEISKKRLGATAVLKGEELMGLITDGDVRRLLERDVDLNAVKAKDIMTTTPVTIGEEALAVEALDKMRKADISQLVVTEGKNYKGIIHLHELVKEGII
jgi:arabinose-5-phosphate isomerase